MIARQDGRGFTLLELLVAMAIFAIAGVAVIRTTSEHIRAVTQLEELTIASYIAENQLQLAKLDTTWPPEARLQGEVEMAQRRWLWQLVAEQTPDPEFRQLTVTISPVDEPNRQIYSLRTFVGKADD